MSGAQISDVESRECSGLDTGAQVYGQNYLVPFRITGKLDKLTLKIDRPKLTPEDEKRLVAAQRKASDQKPHEPAGAAVRGLPVRNGSAMSGNPLAPASGLREDSS